MTLAHAGLISLTTPSGLCAIPGTDDVAVTHASGGTQLRTYDVPTRTQVVANIAVTNAPASITALTSNLIATISSGSNTAHIINLTTNAVSNVTINSSAVSSFNGQQIAGDAANGVALGTSSTAGNIVKITSALVGSVISPSWATGVITQAVIKRSDSNNFIFATRAGVIVECDANGKAVHQYAIPSPKMFYTIDSSSLTLRSQWVSCMAYHKGYLLVSTHLGQLILFDHDLGKEIYRETIGAHSNSLGLNFGANEHVVVGAQGIQAGAAGTTIFELDMFRIPFDFRGYLFPTSGQSPQGAGVVVIVGSTAVLSNANGNTLEFATISGARTVDYVDTTINPSSPVEGHCLVLDDNGTAGSCELMFASPVGVNGREIPVTQGSELVKFAASGVGQTEQFGWTRPT